jgi:hypothetical protein
MFNVMTAFLLFILTCLLVGNCAAFQQHIFKSSCDVGLLSALSATPDQLQVLTRRGEIEEKLMAQNQFPLVHKSGDATETLRKDGVVRIDNVLSDSTVNRLRDYLVDLQTRSLQAVQAGEVPFSERFANVMVNTERRDLKIPLGPTPVLDALEEILGSPVGRAMEALLGKDCTLYELSCLISNSGSQRQNVHPDHPCTIENDGRDSDGDPLLLTCFVALQDVCPDMGPTVWIPGTHNPKAHDRFQRIRVEDVMDSESPKDNLLRTTPSVVGLLPKGSCAIFDSRLLHCGTANSSEKKTRALFYVSFKHPKVGYPGNEGSIGYGLDTASLQLGKLCHELQDRSQSARLRHLYQNP